MNDWLDEIEERAQKADKGPWRFYLPRFGERYIVATKRHYRADRLLLAGTVGNKDQARNNGDFMAEAREDIPRLVAEVRRLRGVLQEIECAEPGEVWYPTAVGMSEGNCTGCLELQGKAREALEESDGK